jgi:beta-phosphoglucomutase-like phosphatase (HAD superfamily)
VTGPGRRAAVFDMDGVLVDNARFHDFTHLAWAALASP